MRGPSLRTETVRDQEMAAYYVWSALRGHEGAGRSPRTGGQLYLSDLNRSEAVALTRQLYAVKARFFADRARKRRLALRRFLP